MNVAILGASLKPERYSNRAQQMLMAAEHSVFPVSPKGDDILGSPGYSSLSEIDKPIDTVTLYLGPDRLRTILDELIALAPKRVIFNPGTEDDSIQKACEEAGIRTVKACTLVLLSTGEFETA